MRFFLLFVTMILGLALPAAGQQVTGLSGWSLYLDPGHGGSNQNVGVFGYSEANKVLAIGLHLRQMLLQTTDIDTVYMSRTTDVDVSLSQRVDHANSVGASHFHSIHSNAAAPGVNFVMVLWPQYPDGSEAVPNGGRRMSQIMSDRLARAMRIQDRGAIGECDFYGASSCRSPQAAPKGSRNYVQSFTVMPSELSEAGFHTNPVQNQRNMNAEWKRLEARAMYRSILAYHGLAAPAVRVLTGIVSDLESGRPINGATVTVGDRTYVTDSYASLFNRYSNDPDELANGFYYLEDLPAGALPLAVEAPGYTGTAEQVTVADTFLTFRDLRLVSTVPPTVAATNLLPENFRVVDPIVIDFSRVMDRASVEQAFSLSPHVGGIFNWSNGDRRLTFNPDTLLPLTDYTLTVGAGALGAYGHAFDANGDGTPGDAFVAAFRTGFPDTQAPRLVAASPAPNASGVARSPVLALYYDEPLDPASLEGRVTLERSAGGAVPGQLRHYVVDERSVLNFFPADALLPNETYRLLVAAGVRDAFGNEERVQKVLRFTTEGGVFDPLSIDDFEDGVAASWWDPQQSGSTTGIVTDSTGRDAATGTAVPLHGGTTSLRVRYGWNTGADAWLIREYLGGGAPRDVVFDSTYQLQAYVFGDGSGNRFRFAVDDAVGTAGTGHEVSPWYTIDWIGWRLVSWNMGREGTGSWIGNGVLDGTLRFDSIQLTYAPGSPAFGTLYFDDLRAARHLARGVASEDEPMLPTQVSLHPAYPNPFNPAATIGFDLPEAGEVTLKVFNLAGAEVATLIAGETLAAGEHRRVWNAAGLPSGVYFCRLQAGGRSLVQKLVLLK